MDPQVSLKPVIPVADQTVSVSTTDDDVAGFTVSEPGGSTTVTEAGDTDTFTVVLNAQPCLLYTSPSPRDRQKSRMPSSA